MDALREHKPCRRAWTTKRNYRDGGPERGKEKKKKSDLGRGGVRQKEFFISCDVPCRHKKLWAEVEKKEMSPLFCVQVWGGAREVNQKNCI